MDENGFDIWFDTLCWTDIADDLYGNQVLNELKFDDDGGWKLVKKLQ